MARTSLLWSRSRSGTFHCGRKRLYPSEGKSLKYLQSCSADYFTAEGSRGAEGVLDSDWTAQVLFLVLCLMEVVSPSLLCFHSNWRRRVRMTRIKSV